MKRIILMTLVIIMTIPVLAQQNQTLFSQLTEKYADKDGFSASMLTSDLFDLYLKKKNLDEDSPVYDALKQLDKIIVISQSNLMRASAVVSGTGKNISAGDEDTDSEIHQTMLNYYKKENYTLFKTEKRMGEDVKVFLKKDQDKIKSLALVTNSSTSTNLVELDGDIDLSTVAELNKTLNLKGLENLYKIDDSSRFWGYSTGVGTGYSRANVEELVTRQRDLYEKQKNLSEKQREEMVAQTRQRMERQAQIAEKYRQLAETYGRQPIFLSTPGDTNTVYYLNGKKVKAKDIKELDKEKIESVELKKGETADDKTVVRIKTK